MIIYCFIVVFYWCAIDSAPMPPLALLNMTNRVACCLFSSRAKTWFLAVQYKQINLPFKGPIDQTSTVIVISLIGFHNCEVCFPREKSDAIICVGCNSLIATGYCSWFVEIWFSMYMPNEGFNTMEDFRISTWIIPFLSGAFRETIYVCIYVNTLPSHTPLPSLPTTLSLLHTHPATVSMDFDLAQKRGITGHRHCRAKSLNLVLNWV